MKLTNLWCWLNRAASLKPTWIDPMTIVALATPITQTVALACHFQSDAARGGVGNLIQNGEIASACKPPEEFTDLNAMIEQ